MALALNTAKVEGQTQQLSYFISFWALLNLSATSFSNWQIVLFGKRTAF